MHDRCFDDVIDFVIARNPDTASSLPFLADASTGMNAERARAWRQLRAAGFFELVAVEGEIEESASLWLRIADEQSNVSLRE